MNYLCGCNPEEKKSYLQTTQADGTQSSKRRDTQGYEVCPEHGERLYGWNTHTIPHQGLGDLLDFKKMGSGDGSKLKLDFTTEDRRDNRDPQLVGAEHLSHSNGGGNSSNSAQGNGSGNYLINGDRTPFGVPRD